MNLTYGNTKLKNLLYPSFCLNCYRKYAILYLESRIGYNLNMLSRIAQALHCRNDAQLE